jgi:hypothetical protein
MTRHLLLRLGLGAGVGAGLSASSEEISSPFAPT